MNKKLWYVTAIVLAIVNIVMYLVIPLPDRVFVFWDDLSRLVSIALAAVFLLQASRIAGSADQKAFRLFALGFGCRAIGHLLWVIFDFTSKSTAKPFPSLSDIGFFAFYAFMLLGLLFLLKHYLPLISKVQWIAAAGVLIALLAVASFFVRPAMDYFHYYQLSWLPKFLIFAYPLLGIVVIALILPIVLLFAGGNIGQSWLITVVGFAAIAAVDIRFPNLHVTGHFITDNAGLLSALGGLLVAVGSLRFTHSHTTAS